MPARTVAPPATHARRRPRRRTPPARSDGAGAAAPASRQHRRADRPPRPAADPAVTVTQIADARGAGRPAWRTGDDGLYVVEQGGRVLRLADGEPSTVLDISDLTDAEGERGLLGLAFAPGGRPGVRQLHRPRRRDDHRRVPGRRRRHVPHRRQRPLDVRDRAAVPEPQRRRPDVRAGRDALHRHGRRRLRRRSGAAGAPTCRRRSASCCASTRRRRAASRTRCRRTTPSSATPAPTREIWSSGLRNPWRFSFDRDHGRSVDRRRRPGRLRGDRRRPGDERCRRRQGPQLRVERVRGRRALQRRRAGGRPHAADLHVRPQRRRSVQRSRAACGCARVTLAGWYVYGDYCSGTVVGAGGARRGRRHRGRTQGGARQRGEPDRRRRRPRRRALRLVPGRPGLRLDAGSITRRGSNSTSGRATSAATRRTRIRHRRGRHGGR